MKTSRRLIAIVGMAFLPFISSGAVGAETEIWQKLAGGGYVVLMRHASTETGNEAGNPLVRDETCKTERNLSNKGKREALSTGKMFTQKGVPLEEVLASPYCRTMDTAKITFGKAAPVGFLSLAEVLSGEQADEAAGQLSRKIGSHSGNKNLILITHAPNINAVSFEPIGMGAFIVFEPMGGDAFEEVGVINPAD